MFLLRRSLPSAFVSALLLSGCSSPTTPVAGLEIRPAARSFTMPAQGSVDVPYAVVNAGESPVVLVTRCGDRLLPVVQRRERGEPQGLCEGWHRKPQG